MGGGPVGNGEKRGGKEGIPPGVVRGEVKRGGVGLREAKEKERLGGKGTGEERRKGTVEI